MTVDAATKAVREILLVLALAVLGVLLALLAAFGPWYGAAGNAVWPAVVEMHAPPGPPAAELTAELTADDID